MPHPDLSLPHADDDSCDILLVDDSPDTRALLHDELTVAGYHVHIAASGEESLRHFASHHPGAVLLDVVMPGMDGFATCERIREISEEVPVIFMTGLGETEHIVRGFACGGNDYVTKPVVLPEVIARIQAHTRTARLVRTTREGLNASPTAMLAFDSVGTLLWANDAASALLPAFRMLPGRSLHNTPLQPLLALREAAPASLQGVAMQDTGVLVHRASEAGQDITIVTLQKQTAASGSWTPPQLTARESEVLLWVARGKTNRDIAEILGMSPRTVNKHLEHIFEKLGVETRTAAADAARKLNMGV